MEKRIASKVETYINSFKNDIKEHLETYPEIDNNNKVKLLQFIYDYQNLSLDKEDFTKRKRVKSVVPHYLKCMACRANGEQCTRKKKDDGDFCGTHDKNRPHGIINAIQSNEIKLKKMEVWIEEINGILYYIDKFNNIYKTEDIISNKVNPAIIAKYKFENGEYLLA
tara:strand:+ start:7613 stop:8113 length:501 start_codon:yes stop_codon:yes gene_type:complete